MADTVTWPLLRELASFRAENGCATTLYLNLDPSEVPTAGDAQTRMNALLNTAEKTDRNDRGARTDISAIKIYVPAAYTRVVDRAIQVWGAAGVSNDLPLAAMYLGARTLRLADGPDEVHKILIAKNVVHRYEQGDSWDFGN